MKVIAINGSPRKDWSTHVLLDNCLRGAEEAGAETELINLYDVNYKGCTSCFACKRKGTLVNQCVVKDEMEPILQKICECDALVLGSPVYMENVTGEMRSFWERLLFPYMSYELKPSHFNKKINTAYIYTMNLPKLVLPVVGYYSFINDHKRKMKSVFGKKSKALLVTSTYQFDDYSKYAVKVFSGEKRKRRRENVFPHDCEKAFNLGRWLCR